MRCFHFNGRVIKAVVEKVGMLIRSLDSVILVGCGAGGIEGPIVVSGLLLKSIAVQ